MGKRKIHPLLFRFCERRGLRCPAVVTVGRLVADAGGLRAVPPRLDNRRRRRRPAKPPKPKGFRARRTGEVLAVDTMIAVRDRVRRYLFACLDLRSRFGLAVATPGMSSRWARDFADLAFDLFPGPVDRVRFDNGSEYESRFADLLSARGIARYYTYPKSPKMNAYAERFNRTVQEEFLDYHEDLLRGDEANLARLNRKLAEWLLRHNGERPHGALGQLTPIAALGRERSTSTTSPRPPPRAAESATPPPRRTTSRSLSSMKRCQADRARTLV